MRYAVSIYDTDDGSHHVQLIIARNPREAVLLHEMCPWEPDPDQDDFDTDEAYEEAQEEHIPCPDELDDIISEAADLDRSIVVKEIT